MHFLPPLGSENSAKSSIAFVLKMFVFFPIYNDTFIYNIAEIDKKLGAKCKNSIKFLARLYFPFFSKNKANHI